MNIKALKSNHFRSLMSVVKVSQELIKTTQLKKIGGTISYFVSLIFLIVVVNILGIVPYIFSFTSHLAINLSVSLPAWISLFLIRASFRTFDFVAHFQPTGSPAALNPFLCLVELLSNFIRPITLSVRLTANITAGHILIGLIGVAFSASSGLLAFSIVCLGVGYFIFEGAICIIQAYIFSSLLAMYMDEHSG